MRLFLMQSFYIGRCPLWAYGAEPHTVIQYRTFRKLSRGAHLTLHDACCADHQHTGTSHMFCHLATSVVNTLILFKHLWSTRLIAAN